MRVRVHGICIWRRPRAIIGSADRRLEGGGRRRVCVRMGWIVEQRGMDEGEGVKLYPATEVAPLRCPYSATQMPPMAAQEEVHGRVPSPVSYEQEVLKVI